MEEDKAEEEEQEKDEEGEEGEEKEEQEVVTGLCLYFMLCNSFTTTSKRPLPIRSYSQLESCCKVRACSEGAIRGTGGAFPV